MPGYKTTLPIIPWNKGKQTGLRLGCKVNQHGERRSDEEVFVENSTYARHILKNRIIKQNLITYQCACCNIGPLWQGKPMPLILDHINGINNDNRIENLRWDTHANNNADRKRHGTYATGKLHHMYGKKMPEEHKRRLIHIHQTRIRTPEELQKLS